MPAPSTESLHIKIRTDVLRRCRRLADREQEGNTSRMVRELIDEALAAREAAGADAGEHRRPSA